MHAQWTQRIQAQVFLRINYKVKVETTQVEIKILTKKILL